MSNDMRLVKRGHRRGNFRANAKTGYGVLAHRASRSGSLAPSGCQRLSNVKGQFVIKMGERLTKRKMVAFSVTELTVILHYGILLMFGQIGAKLPEECPNTLEAKAARQPEKCPNTAKTLFPMKLYAILREVKVVNK
jgi:hypothetical protein